MSVITFCSVISNNSLQSVYYELDPVLDLGNCKRGKKMAKVSAFLGLHWNGEDR